MDETTAGAIGLVISLIYLAIIVVLVVSYWKIFTKAGKPGWACLIPIYNGIVMIEIAGKPLWWIILFFVPFVNVVMLFLVCIALAERYGKSAGFGVGLALLPIVFAPLLAFSDADYSAAEPAAA